VTPRIIVEYADFNHILNLERSDDLNQVASAVSPRIIVEYADFMASYGLQQSEDLDQTASAVTPRIIVEYAKFIFTAGLGPKPLEDNTPPVIENVYQQPLSDNVQPDDRVMVYAEVTDDSSGIKHVLLSYTTNNGTWFTEEMTNLEENLYNATIPQFPYCTNITYIIIAEDNADNTITTADMGYEYQYHVIPEFPSATIILPLFIALTTLVIITKKKHTQPT
ncbi:MAG: hypothetical protein ACLFU9_06005, partial [Candidatus Bathyarchaeia archaeon]